MGHDLATLGPQYSVGKQTLVSSSSADVGVPGKSTLTESLESSPSADLVRVARRAGERVVDKGKFEYVVRPDGSFEITKAPDPYTTSAGKTISIEKVPAIWGILHDLLLAQPSASKPAPSAAKPAPSAAKPVEAARPVPRAEARAPRAAASPAELAANDTRVRGKKKATLEGSTLEIAETRSALGNANTHYRREDAAPADVQKMVTGTTDASTFWCSGFSMWTLAAAGYNLDSQVVGSDGKPFTYTAIVTAKEKDAEKKQATIAKARSNEQRMKQVTDAGFVLADDEFPTWGTITFRQLIDGHGLPVLMMSTIERDPHKPGGWLGVVREPANSFDGLIDGADNTALAAMGAAGAFELFGIGRVVPEAGQKPGDFAQERWLVNGVYNGAGHAFQVWSVTAKGSAMFGKDGSPEPLDDATAAGWKDSMTFRITKDTDPSLVGEHVVVSATRIEANIEGAFAAQSGAAKKPAPKGDGGVQITGERPVPDVNKLHAGCVVFYGRLGSSRWAQWTKATKPSP